MVETCDVVVLGAGPAGIAAARSLRKQGKAVIVLEARSRVGGRAFTSDSLGVNFPLDHGAKWIHGGSPENRIVQLWRELDQRGDSRGPSDANKEQTTAKKDKTPPPFDIDAETEYQINQKIPTTNMTKVIYPAVNGNLVIEPTAMARKAAKQAFKDIIKTTMKDPNGKINPECTVDEKEELLETASLLDILMMSVPHYRQSDNNVISEQEKHKTFDTFCCNQLLPQHPCIKKAMDLLEGKEAKEMFLEEVTALFIIEIYTFFESWEGAPIHQISASYGLETTCLPGGNVVVPFGYGGLIQKLARMLLEGEQPIIRLEHKVISVTTSKGDDGSRTKVVVKCHLASCNEIKEFHASACIVALPLGVLRNAVQENSNSEIYPKFNPELPAPIQHSIQSLGITARNKIELLFPFRFWPETIGRLTLACRHLHQSPTYHPYTTFLVESASVSTRDGGKQQAMPNILVCYVGGDFARETELKTDIEIQNEIMKVLRDADFGTGVPNPITVHVTRWVSDPYSRGSWTFLWKGLTPEDITAFRNNEECHERRLFFAGEHTCSGSFPGDDIGCVHGAWGSGELAANAAVQSMSK